MAKLNVYQNGFVKATIKGYVENGIFKTKDIYGRTEWIKSWAQAMRYLNPRMGDSYYNTYEDAVDDWNEGITEEDKLSTIEDVKKQTADWQIAEMCNGYIEIDDEDEDEEEDDD
jgi:hypothetical protein